MHEFPSVHAIMKQFGHDVPDLIADHNFYTGKVAPPQGAVAQTTSDGSSVLLLDDDFNKSVDALDIAGRFDLLAAHMSCNTATLGMGEHTAADRPGNQASDAQHGPHGPFVGDQGIQAFTAAFPEPLRTGNGMPLCHAKSGAEAFHLPCLRYRFYTDGIFKCDPEEVIMRQTLFSALKELETQLTLGNRKPLKLNENRDQKKFIALRAGLTRIIGEGSEVNKLSQQYSSNLSGIIAHQLTHIAFSDNDLSARLLAAMLCYDDTATIEQVRGQVPGEKAALFTVTPEDKSGKYARIGGVKMSLHYPKGDNPDCVPGGDPSFMTQVQALGEGTKVVFDTAFGVLSQLLTAGDQLCHFGDEMNNHYAAGANKGALPLDTPDTRAYMSRPQDYIGNLVKNVYAFTENGLQHSVVEFEKPWSHVDGSRFGILKRSEFNPKGVKVIDGPGRSWRKYSAAEQVGATKLDATLYGDGTIGDASVPVFKQRVAQQAADFTWMHWDEYVKLQEEVAERKLLKKLGATPAGQAGPGVHTYSIKPDAYKHETVPPNAPAGAAPTPGSDEGLRRSPLDETNNGYVMDGSNATDETYDEMSPVAHSRTDSTFDFQRRIDQLAAMKPMFLMNYNRSGESSNLATWNIGKCADMLEANGSELLVICGDDVAGKKGLPFSENAELPLTNQTGRPLAGGLATADGSIIVHEAKALSHYAADPVVMKLLFNSAQKFEHILSGFEMAEFQNPIASGFDENVEQEIGIHQYLANDNLVHMLNMMYLEPRRLNDDPALSEAENYLMLYTDEVDPKSPWTDWILSMLEPMYGIVGSSEQSPGMQTHFSNRHMSCTPTQHIPLNMMLLYMRIWATNGWRHVQDRFSIGDLNVEKLISPLQAQRALDTPPRTSRGRNGRKLAYRAQDGTIADPDQASAHVRYTNSTLDGGPFNVNRDPATGDYTVGLADRGSIEGVQETQAALRAMSFRAKAYNGCDQPSGPKMARAPVGWSQKFTTGRFKMMLKTVSNTLHVEDANPLIQPYPDMLKPEQNGSIAMQYNTQWGKLANSTAIGGSPVGTDDPWESFPGFNLEPEKPRAGGGPPVPQYFQIGTHANGNVVNSLAGMRAPSVPFSTLRTWMPKLMKLHWGLMFRPALDPNMWDYLIAQTGGETVAGGSVLEPTAVPPELQPAMTKSDLARRVIPTLPSQELRAPQLWFDKAEHLDILKESLTIAQANGPTDNDERTKPSQGLVYDNPLALLNPKALTVYWKDVAGTKTTTADQLNVIPGKALTPAQVAENEKRWVPGIESNGYAPVQWNLQRRTIPALRVGHSPLRNCPPDFAVPSLLLPRSAASFYVAPSGTFSYQSFHPLRHGRPLFLPSMMSRGGTENESLVLSEYLKDPRIFSTRVVPIEWSSWDLSRLATRDGEEVFEIDNAFREIPTGKRASGKAGDNPDPDVKMERSSGEVMGGSPQGGPPVPQ